MEFFEVIADGSPRILNLLLDHWLGNPPEQIHQEQVVCILDAREDNKAQDAEVVDAGQFSLPEGNEKEEGRELF